MDGFIIGKNGIAHHVTLICKLPLAVGNMKSADLERKIKNKFDMKNKLSIKQKIKAGFILLVSGSLPSWWWSDLSDKFYESKIAHDYKDGKFDYRTIRAWFLEQ